MRTFVIGTNVINIRPKELLCVRGCSIQLLLEHATALACSLRACSLLVGKETQTSKGRLFNLAGSSCYKRELGGTQTHYAEEETPVTTSLILFLSGRVSGLWGKEEGTERKRIMLGLRKDIILDIQQKGHGQGQN